jgi:hypothetical protein
MEVFVGIALGPAGLHIWVGRVLVVIRLSAPDFQVHRSDYKGDDQP